LSKTVAWETSAFGRPKSAFKDDCAVKASAMDVSFLGDEMSGAGREAVGGTPESAREPSPVYPAGVIMDLYML
jgi:hypothetical protein